SAAAWAVGASMSYASGGNTLAFAGYRNLVGGNGKNTFAISGSPTANLFGGTGADTFQVAAEAVLTGTIDGGAGSDTIDGSAYQSARRVTLTAVGAVDGFAGTEASLSGGFTNIDALVGGAGHDTLAGLNAPATWQVGAADQYTSGNTLGFRSFENLVGGSGADTFAISGSPTANLSGGAGADAFQF